MECLLISAAGIPAHKQLMLVWGSMLRCHNMLIGWVGLGGVTPHTGVHGITSDNFFKAETSVDTF